MGRSERVEGGQSRMGSLRAGWWRVSRERARSSRSGVGSMVLAWLIRCNRPLDEVCGILWFGSWNSALKILYRCLVV